MHDECEYTYNRRNYSDCCPVCGQVNRIYYKFDVWNQGQGETSIDVLIVEYLQKGIKQIIKRGLKPSEIEHIKMGKFIPGLFKDCQSNKTKKRRIK